MAYGKIMSIIPNVIFIFLIFWLSANFGSASFYRSLKEKSTTCSIAVDKKGWLSIKLYSHLLIVKFLLLSMMAWIYGGLALILQSLIFTLIIEIFDVSLATALNTDIEHLVAFTYGVIIYWGFYMGKSMVANFAAETILIYTHKVVPQNGFPADSDHLIMQKALENRKGKPNG
jgi:hypothetical protein